MRKTIRRLLMALVLFLLLLGGGVWWLLSYIAPEEKLDLAYEPFDVKQQVMSMIKKMKPELVLTEPNINNLVKMSLKSKLSSDGQSPLEIGKDVQLEGAYFELEQDKLIARMNVRYKDRIPAGFDAVYTMEWQEPNIVLVPQSLSIKRLSLPINTLETITIPLDLPRQDVVTVRDVQFLVDQIIIKFKINLQLDFKL